MHRRVIVNFLTAERIIWGFKNQKSLVLKKKQEEEGQEERKKRKKKNEGEFPLGWEMDGVGEVGGGCFLCVYECCVPGVFDGWLSCLR